MKCPACREPDLLMSERQGIEIDYCPTCRGVWLDRGELDKIIERSSTQTAPAQPQPSSFQNQSSSHHSQPSGGHHSSSSPYKRKRESWLSDLFD